MAQVKKLFVMLTLLSSGLQMSSAKAQSRNDYYGSDPDYPNNPVSIPYFIEEPENVTTRLGQRVELDCRVGNANPNSSVQWTQDDFGLGTKELMHLWPNLRVIDTNPESKSFKAFFKQIKG
jgi:hypothetical protein